jgi:16S rRNA (guanine527-N7)-methyltransferase
MDAGLVQRLADRAGLAGLAVPPVLAEPLVTYFALLSRWNAKINLTSLTDPDEAIDRLLLEPVAASAYLPHRIRLMDLGSGGGSPAIPLALAAGATHLVMIESRGRKAAFLREAARAVALPFTVEAARFEDVAAAGSYAGSMDAVSMRAVRMDASSLGAAGTFLKSDGRLALFVSVGSTVELGTGLELQGRHALVGDAEVMVAGPHVPRGTLPQ